MAEAGVDPPAQIPLIGQFALTLEAQTGGSIGLGLSRALGRQPLDVSGGLGDFLFHVAQVLFGLLLNEPQAGLQVLAPGQHFRVGQMALSNGLGLSGLCRLSRAVREDRFGEALVFCLRALPGLGTADLACGFRNGGHIMVVGDGLMN
jgi:hypothetical protein